MEDFLGTWKVESNEDYYKFLNHFGVPSPIAKLVMLFGSTMVFSKVDEDTYGMSVSTVKGKTHTTFKLGEEFDGSNPGGESLKSRITVENRVMKQLQYGGGHEILTTRTVNGNIMTAVYTVGDLTCTRIYKRSI